MPSSLHGPLFPASPHEDGHTVGGAWQLCGLSLPPWGPPARLVLGGCALQVPPPPPRGSQRGHPAEMQGQLQGEPGQEGWGVQLCRSPVSQASPAGPQGLSGLFGANLAAPHLVPPWAFGIRAEQEGRGGGSVGELRRQDGMHTAPPGEQPGSRLRTRQQVRQSSRGAS